MLASFTHSGVNDAAARGLQRRALRLCGALLALGLLAQAPALAAPAAAGQHGAATGEAATPASGSEWSFVSWGNAAALLLLAGGSAYALYLRWRGPAPGAHAPLEAVGQFSLGPSQQLRLVACGGEVLLLGVTAEEVTLLKTYPREDFDALRAEEGEASADEAPAASNARRADAAWPERFSEALGRFARRDASA